MISMLCQKSNSGIIKSDNLDLFNYVFQGEQKIETNNINEEESRFSKYNSELDSDFLKKFPTLYKVNHYKMEN